MTILVTADWHFSDNSRDAYRFIFPQKILPKIILKHQIKELLFLGDLTEQKDFHGAPLVNDVVEVIHNLAQMVRITMVMGNHDATDVSNPFFGFLDRIPNVRFFNRPHREGDFVFLPHTRDPERDWAEVDFTGAKLIFAHNTFNGATGGFGRELTGLDLDLLPKIPIISGDIHVPQKFRNLIYVGAPYTCDFGDEYQGRVLKIDGKDISGIAIKMPQKWVYRVEDLAVLPRDRFRKCDVIRVEVPIKRADYAQWPSITRLIKAWAADCNIELESVIPVLIDKQIVGKAKTREIQSKVTDEEVIKEYAKLHQIDERTLLVGLGLLT